MSGISSRQAIMTLAVALLIGMSGMPSLVLAADDPKANSTAPGGASVVPPPTPAPAAAATATGPSRLCSEFEMGRKLYEKKYCLKVATPVDNKPDDKKPAKTEPETKPGVCSLTTDTKTWTESMNDVRNVTRSMTLIIDGLATSAGDYRNENFGGDEVTAQDNRETARQRFEKAKSLLDRVIRRVAGEARQECRECYLVSDWNLVRSAAAFIYESRNLDAADRVGAGWLAENKAGDKAIQVTSDTIVETSIGDAADQSAISGGQRIVLGEVDADVFSCLIRKMNPKATKGEEALTADYITSMARELCDGMTDFYAGRTSGRLKQIRNLQAKINYLLMDKQTCETESMDKTPKRTMTVLKGQVKCNNEASPAVWDFFLPQGEAVAKSEVCKWAETLEGLAKTQVRDRSAE